MLHGYEGPAREKRIAELAAHVWNHASVDTILVGFMAETEIHHMLALVGRLQ